MPSAWSSESAPVGMTEISSSGPPAPSRMTEPLPNCRSICEMASSSACRRSFLLSAMRGLLVSGGGRAEVKHACILGARARTRQCPGTWTARSRVGAGRVSLALHAAVQLVLVQAAIARDAERVGALRLPTAGLQVLIERGRRGARLRVDPVLAGAGGQSEGHDAQDETSAHAVETSRR